MSSIRPSPNWLLHTLPEAELEALDSRLELVELVRETALVEAGQSLMQVYLPDGGAISVMVRLSEGQMAEVATIGRDSILGAAAALDGEISLTSAVAVLSGKASVLDAADFRATADRTVTFRAVVSLHEQALLAMAQQSAACNASHSVEARLSRWLLRARDFCERRHLGADSGFSGPTDWRATKRNIDRRPCAAASTNYPLQPGLHRYYQCGRSDRGGLRVLCRRQGASSALVEDFVLRPPH